MGKMKKTRDSTKNLPLAEQILIDKHVQQSSSAKEKAQKRGAQDEEFVDSKLSGRILAQAKAQQEELAEEFGTATLPKAKKSVQLSIGKGVTKPESDSEEDLGEDDYEDIDVDSGEEEALEKFMSKTPAARRTLGDAIRETLQEKKTNMSAAGFVMDGASDRFETGMSERMETMFKQIGALLKRYRSGKLPLAFKKVPHLVNWETVMFVMEPDTWSAAAVYQATRIFISNLNHKMAQRYVNMVLLPRVRDDISEYKKLNVHLYMAVKKSLFKPQAFFKGFLLPLCQAGDCTLREAVIIAGILSKISIPMLHSAAALLKIAEMEYNGANSIFLRCLLDKKYALPCMVVDALVHHYLAFATDKRVLPVLWHQSLLVFAQRYKSDISSEQRAALLDLLRAQSHGKITPDIRRELQGAVSRDVEDVAMATGFD